MIIGENRSFDHVFATYVPKGNQKVWNLLSEGIVKADGTPGPNFYKAHQHAAWTRRRHTGRTILFCSARPRPISPATCFPPRSSVAPRIPTSPGDSISAGRSIRKRLCPPDYYQYLISGGTGLTSHTPDTRITNVNTLPAGPFQLTNGNLFTYNSYAASPVHRFYQMWQQLDCSRAHIT